MKQLIVIAAIGLFATACTPGSSEEEPATTLAPTDSSTTTEYTGES